MTRGIVRLAARSACPYWAPFAQASIPSVSAPRSSTAPFMSRKRFRDTDRARPADWDSHPRRRIITLSVTLLHYLRNLLKRASMRTYARQVRQARGLTAEFTSYFTILRRN